MRRNFRRLPLAALALLTLAACGKKDAATAPEAQAPAPQEIAPAPSFSSADWTDASADFVNPAGETVGRIEFKDGLGGVLMRINISGLTPGWHGIHLHMIADCSDGADGFKASGGHINPDNSEHGLLNPNGAHRADIPNIFAGADGNAEAEIFRAGVNLKPSEEGAAINGPYPLMDDDGFAVIVHADPDDHMTQPIGGAGARVACAAVK